MNGHSNNDDKPAGSGSQASEVKKAAEAAAQSEANEAASAAVKCDPSDDPKEVTIYRGLDATSPSQFRVDPDGVSTFETPSAGKKMQLPIKVRYKGEKKEGTEGELLDNDLKAQGGKAVYTPSHGGEGHWSLQFPGKSDDEVKKILSSTAKKKAVKTSDLPI
jgi:hypothetical protein